MVIIVSYSILPNNSENETDTTGKSFEELQEIITVDFS